MYNNDRASEAMDPDCPSDQMYGNFFILDHKRYDDLKQMLDSNRDHLKLEAMKRVIEMVAKGKNASDLFPAVVKNVVSKNIEIKKLVYAYLVRYAEERQDLALLSISTFQRALKEPNQLIRASALRVLSNIRVVAIVPIVMLAIRDASSDLSPYVRKTAAHAIPKLYSLEQKLKPELVLVIQKLLTDKTVLVVSSAVMAFTEVCPERVDLIQQVFRKLCSLLVDVDGWGQVIIVNMLTRYARTQFADPNLQTETESDNCDSEKEITLDPDHRLLIRSTRPLLQSQNAAVVMAVAQLYYHCAHKKEIPHSAKALIRLLRSHIEVQSIVLSNIASITMRNKETFAPYLKSFFVRTSDPVRVKLLKLDILTNIATDFNVSIILKELQTYIVSSDQKFVAATIQAIGRCAYAIFEVAEVCLSGLITLLSNKDEAVVAESVVVIKLLLHTQAGNCKEIIIRMTRLLDTITIPQARAAILWLLAEHSDEVPLIAPDVLRKVTKTFPEEDNMVKLQILNLAIKLWILYPEETRTLCQYLFDLARYDQSYDIRDRTRMLRQFTRNPGGKITSQIARVFLAVKPTPQLRQQAEGRGEHLQLGSLSQYIKTAATGYEPLPEFTKLPLPKNNGEGESYDDDDKIGLDTPVEKKRSENCSESSSFTDSSDSSSTSAYKSSADSEGGSKSDDSIFNFEDF